MSYPHTLLLFSHPPCCQRHFIDPTALIIDFVLALSDALEPCFFSPFYVGRLFVVESLPYALVFTVFAFRVSFWFRSGSIWDSDPSYTCTYTYRSVHRMSNMAMQHIHVSVISLVSRWDRQLVEPGRDFPSRRRARRSHSSHSVKPELAGSGFSHSRPMDIRGLRFTIPVQGE